MGGNGRLPYNRARASSRAERALTKLDCKKLPAAKLTLTADRFGSNPVGRVIGVSACQKWLIDFMRKRFNFKAIAIVQVIAVSGVFISWWLIELPHT
jgi:hypothetical protein